ncbi:MAG: phosphate signaling complex protein PhoU [Deltaproteobacteria bacterium]|nr:phosphate signaling complex protein PhoU [Deltaproteobacteria bacterium]
MSKHLQRELDNLKKELLLIASMVENATQKALTALVDRRQELAEEVIGKDFLINEKEVKIEEECLKILALYQPVAIDLRFIITALKVNNDLERVGDLAVNIAERAAFLSTQEMLAITLDFPNMAKNVQTMLAASLDALTRNDAELARKVIAMDDAVDLANHKMIKALRRQMQQNPTTIKRAIHLISSSGQLERIADLATNIAEDVIYMVEGEVVRHRTEDFIKKEEEEE